jgi:obg-like ATPase 1
MKADAWLRSLGNAFLSHIKAVDGIFHVIRCFEDEEVIHVEDEVNPIRDMEIIHEELRLKDEEFLLKRLEEAHKSSQRAGQGMDAKARKEEYETIKKIKEWVVDSKKDVRLGDWHNKEVDLINSLQLLTAKSVIYLANLSEKDYIRKKNKFLPKVKAWIDERSRT